ncbi:MAG: cation:proton antiporter [Planctomycetota bacterium]|nr:cation:proton antiporter [Planctomycetota bacterium]MDA1114215.1 cation:proton antiporter [Planctomycetota bacterium]
MELWNVLFDILILLFTAMVFGVVCERFRQSSIIGYLAAGTLLGPNALQIVSNATEVTALAELGVALLLFTIGLEFSWSRLKSLGSAALGGGAVQIFATIAVGMVVSMVFGLTWRTSLILGAIITLSSTACVLRVLVSRAEIESTHGRHALGILLMQDIALVPLVLIVTLVGGDGTLAQVGVDMVKTLAWAAALIVVLYLLLNRVVPKILHMPSLQRNRDLPILLAIVAGMGSASGAHYLGLSPALGAFVAGMLLAESPFATQIRADVASLRILLVTLFFSSIGMLGDPAWFVQNMGSVFALVMAIVVGKAVIIWFVLRRFGLSHTSALATGICLGQVGEFSFVLAEVGRGAGIDEQLFALIISATICTLFITPYLIALAPRLSNAGITLLSRTHLISKPAIPLPRDDASPEPHFIVIGFGPAGEAVAESVRRLPIRVTVIDLNPGLITRVNQLGLSGYIGDAMQSEVLEHVGVATASAVIVTVPAPDAARGMVELIRSISPDVHIIARARYHRFLADLQRGGATVIVDEERTVGIRLAAQLRRHLGTQSGAFPN